MEIENVTMNRSAKKISEHSIFVKVQQRPQQTFTITSYLCFYALMNIMFPFFSILKFQMYVKRIEYVYAKALLRVRPRINNDQRNHV